MTIGNDGFTDCAYVCNPENGMAWSCKEYCPEYKVVATTLRTLTSRVPGNINTNENKVLHMNSVVILCIAIVLSTIIIIVCCLNKRRLRACVNKCRDKVVQPSPTVVQTSATDEEAEPNMSGAGEDERALLRIENENNSNTNNRKTNYDGPSSIKKTINLPHVLDLNNRSVQTITHAVKPHENRLQSITDDANNFSQDETELKETGERAGIAIGQSSSSFASNIVPIEPTTTVTDVTADIESYESGENANTDDCYAETGTDGSKQINVFAGSDRNDSGDNDLSRNEEEDDDDDYDGDDDGDDHDDDDDVDDDNDDDDNDELEEEDMMLIARRDHTNEVITNDNGFTNKTENTLPTDIVPIITKSNFREL